MIDSAIDPHSALLVAGWFCIGLGVAMWALFRAL